MRYHTTSILFLAFIDCTFTAQESTGKQGMLGPRKMYLAVQPAPSAPPPLTPVVPQALHSIQSLQPLAMPTHQVIYYYQMTIVRRNKQYFICVYIYVFHLLSRLSEHYDYTVNRIYNVLGCDSYYDFRMRKTFHAFKNRY